MSKRSHQKRAEWRTSLVRRFGGHATGLVALLSVPIFVVLMAVVARLLFFIGGGGLQFWIEGRSGKELEPIVLSVFALLRVGGIAFCLLGTLMLGALIPSSVRAIRFGNEMDDDLPSWVSLIEFAVAGSSVCAAVHAGVLWLVPGAIVLAGFGLLGQEAKPDREAKQGWWVIPIFLALVCGLPVTTMWPGLLPAPVDSWLLGQSAVAEGPEWSNPAPPAESSADPGAQMEPLDTIEGVGTTGAFLLLFAFLLAGAAMMKLASLCMHGRRGGKLYPLDILAASLPKLSVAALLVVLALGGRAPMMLAAGLAAAVGGLSVGLLASIYQLRRLGRLPLFLGMLGLFPVCSLLFSFAAVLVQVAPSTSVKTWAVLVAIGLIGGGAAGLAGTVGAALFLMQGLSLSLSPSRQIGQEWLDVVASAARRAERPSKTRPLLQAETLVSHGVQARLDDPLDPTPIEVDTSRLAGLAAWPETPLSGLGHLHRALRDPGSLALASTELGDAPRLRAAAWLTHPGLLVHDAATRADPTEAALREFCQEEANPRLRLFWHMSLIRALAAAGRIDRLFAAMNEVTALVDSDEFGDELGAGGFLDLRFDGAEEMNAETEDVGLASSALRTKAFALMIGELRVLRNLAALGGDPTADSVLRRKVGQLTRIAGAFGAEGGASARSTLDEADELAELREEVDGLRELTPEERSEAGVEIADLVLWQLVDRDWILPLVGTMDPGSRVAQAAAWVWWEGKAGVDTELLWGEMPALLLGKADLPNEAKLAHARVLPLADTDPAKREEAREGLMRHIGFSDEELRLDGRLSRGLGCATAIGARLQPNSAQPPNPSMWEQIVAEPWRQTPDEGLLRVRLLATSLEAIGRSEEAAAVARGLEGLARLYGSPTARRAATAVAHQMLGETNELPDTVDLESRLLRARMSAGSVARARQFGDFLYALERHTGGERPPDVDLAEGDVAVFQVVAEGELITAVLGEDLDFRSVPLDPSTLVQAISELRYGLANGMPEHAWRDSRKELSALLLSDIPPPEGRLLYCGPGCLSRLPLSALTLGPHPLGRSVAWARVERPSDMSDIAAAVEGTGRSIAWSDADRPLPHAERECAGLPSFAPLAPERAALCQTLLTTTPIHIACHGEAATLDDAEARLLLRDGRLDAAVLAALKCKSPLVFLSACETAVGQLIPGERAGGLASALLEAGVAAVVATLWPLEDEGAVNLARTFWSSVRSGDDPASALLTARLSVPEDRPWVWSAVELRTGGARSKTPPAR